MATNTKPLRNHQIIYRWAYPAKLLITKEGKTFSVNSVADGVRLLKEWNILEKDDEPQPASSMLQSQSPAWPLEEND